MLLCCKQGQVLRAFNSFGNIDRIASEEVIFALIKCKCLPILLCETDACPTNSAVRHSLDFAFNKVLRFYRDICNYFGISPIEEQISARQGIHLEVSFYSASESDVCRAITNLRWM